MPGGSDEPTLFPVETTYGVAELAATVRRVVAQAFPGEVWVKGQVRNLSRPASGHVYFDLAEPGPLGAAPAALIPVVLFSADKVRVNDVMRTAGAPRITDGVEVRLRGRLDWFAPRGRLQVRMTDIDPAFTLGRLAEDRDRLVAALKAEGLLERNAALALPVLPRRIGLVTSVGSAAYHDFLHELEVAEVGVTVVVADARTQGDGVVRSVTAALARVLAARVDLVALVRGGGARTDLAPFDTEVLVRAVATAPVPVLTGIGHEIDRSVCDEVAHSAHKTPTACAAAIVARVGEARSRTEAVAGALPRATQRLVAVHEDRRRRTATRLARAATRSVHEAERGLDQHRRLLGHAARTSLAERSRRLGTAASGLEAASRRSLTATQGRLDVTGARLRALDPALALARGWSITRTDAGRLVRSPTDAPAGTNLITTVAGGTVRSHVSADPPEPAEAPDASGGTP